VTECALAALFQRMRCLPNPDIHPRHAIHHQQQKQKQHQLYTIPVQAIQ
jgi:hypothetical protein